MFLSATLHCIFGWMFQSVAFPSLISDFYLQLAQGTPQERPAQTQGNAFGFPSSHHAGNCGLCQTHGVGLLAFRSMPQASAFASIFREVAHNGFILFKAKFVS